MITPTVRVRIEMIDGSLWELRFKEKEYRKASCFKSQKTIGLILTDKRIYIKPYYRKVINGELTVYALQMIFDPYEPKVVAKIKRGVAHGNAHGR